LLIVRSINSRTTLGLTNSQPSLPLFFWRVFIDPNSQKAKKFYLVLMTGPSPNSTTTNNANQLPEGLTTEDQNRVKYSKKSKPSVRNHAKRKSSTKGGTEESKQAWIYKKKELYRKRGKEDVSLLFVPSHVAVC
jgi:hypothetical protein